MGSSIAREKVAQAVDILREKDIDVWMTFTRESDSSGEPCLELVLGSNVTWLSAFIVTKKGDTIAIVGDGDVQAVETIGSFKKVIGYTKSVVEPLRAVFEELTPRQIALNYSKDSFAGDGLSHGMYLLLLDIFAGTDFPSRFISADPIVFPLRGRKSPSELAAIRKAVAATEKILDEVGQFIQPGMTEKEIYDFVVGRMKHYGVKPSWDAAYCPGITAGPHSPVGHCFPTDVTVEQGHTVSIDFGLTVDEYSSDLQRTWYVLRDDEDEAPSRVKAAFGHMVEMLEACERTIKPGAMGYEVDAAVRSIITKYGYPEWKYAMGHELGRAAHDGSITLGPKWPRYGKSVEIPIQPGNVFAVESGIRLEDVGPFHFEQDVVVTADGMEYLSTPQKELFYVRRR